MSRSWSRALLWTLTILMMVVIFLFSCQGGEESMATSGRFAIPIARWLTSLRSGATEADFEATLELVQAVVRKTAHFSEYALLGLLVLLLMESYRLRRAGGWAWLTATVYAGTDEVHQLLSGERTGMWQDVALDSVGALAGVLAAILLLKWWRQRRKKSEKD